MKIDLFNFFRFFDPKNPNHVSAIRKFEDALEKSAPEELTDNSEWVKTYRTRVTPPATSDIAVVSPFSAFPWFPQVDNYRDPHRTCNSSACAMTLNYFKPGTLVGARGDDAYIRKVFSIGDTTDHVVQTKVLESYGIKSVFRYDLTFADLDAQLRARKPVVLGILHRGSISNPTGGHMIVVIGKTASGDYVCNDPYGSLNNGYSGPVEQGRGVVYKASELRSRWCPKGNDGWGRVFLTDAPEALSGGSAKK